MVFASPLWLVGLLPWAGLVVYLLPGRGATAVVPFVALWRISIVRSPRRARRWPGASMLLMLLALLLAVLAAANPTVRSGALVAGEMSIILDRGATMAMPSASGESFRGVVRECSERFPLGGKSRVRLVPVPGEALELPGDAWRAAAERFTPTVLWVNLDQVIEKQLSATSGPIIVLSNQKIHSHDERVMQILPEKPRDSVAITSFAARVAPHSQAMLRLENHSDLQSIHLTIASGAASIERDLQLPARGQSVDRFVDLSGMGPVLTAAITPHSTADPWATAYLVRNPSGVQLIVDPAMDDAVKRIAEIYARDRPGGQQPQRAIVSDRKLPEDQPGVWIRAGASVVKRVGELVAVPNAVTRNVASWPDAGGTAAPPDGFVPVVSDQQHAIVAVRESPSRQVWINADLFEWEKTADFVIFFGNVFDWISAGDARYRSIPPVELGDRWIRTDKESAPAGCRPGEWPGIYRSDTAEMIAVNAGQYRIGDGSTSRSSPPAIVSSITGYVGLRTAAYFLALAGMLGAVVCWQRSVSPVRRS